MPRKAGKSVLFEAQLGALRDIDFGIYPFTSSSSTIAAYAPIGAGIPNHKLDKVVGVMKAYSTCVGEGPFTCELFGEEADKLREAGARIRRGHRPPATGRRALMSWPPATASGAGRRPRLALTKLDVLSGHGQNPGLRRL